MELAHAGASMMSNETEWQVFTQVTLAYINYVKADKPVQQTSVASFNKVGLKLSME